MSMFFPPYSAQAGCASSLGCRKTPTLIGMVSFLGRLSTEADRSSKAGPVSGGRGFVDFLVPLPGDNFLQDLAGAFY